MKSLWDPHVTVTEYLLVNILLLQNKNEPLLFAYLLLFEMIFPFDTVSQKKKKKAL